MSFLDNWFEILLVSLVILLIVFPEAQQPELVSLNKDRQIGVQQVKKIEKSNSTIEKNVPDDYISLFTDLNINLNSSKRSSNLKSEGKQKVIQIVQNAIDFIGIKTTQSGVDEFIFKVKSINKLLILGFQTVQDGYSLQEIQGNKFFIKKDDLMYEVIR